MDAHDGRITKNHERALTMHQIPAAQAALIFQEKILARVSRTFALTIPELPGDLRTIVGNAYLLCRIADTIEDDVDLTPEAKTRFHDDLNYIVTGQQNPQQFVDALMPSLSAQTSDAERELIANSHSVMMVTSGFSNQSKASISRCLTIMCRGMPAFQRNVSLAGLRDLGELDRYCYYVAGVVGEMLTDLFCEYSEDIARRRALLMPLAASFGQGLQMTNILKDFWEDRERGVCWLPQDIFLNEQCNLALVQMGQRNDGFQKSMQLLIGITQAHLRNAFKYALLIPPNETGIRNFCLWAIGFAVLSLQKLNQNLSFESGEEVKISRTTVRRVTRMVRWAVRHDRLLKWMFQMAIRGLPEAQSNLIKLSAENQKLPLSELD
ncbi:MAG: phytoene/squalene synthase family protein [Gammaproteobacteria bacterium]